MSKKASSIYFTPSGRTFPEEVEVLGVKYKKVEDLRYGTNPNQGAAFYRPVDREDVVLGRMEVLKTGKGGLSQTNIEDMHHALSIVKYFEQPACAVMKHLNPSGAAVQYDKEPQLEVYRKARDCDPQAAFGSVVAFNTPVSVQTAEEIMATVVEGVVAPGFEPGAPEVWGMKEIKVLGDGSVIVADPFLSSIRGVEDLKPAETRKKNGEVVKSAKTPTPAQARDLLFAWYVNFNVRSNGVVIAREGRTLAVGTGQQDRIGAVEQAIAKAMKYSGADALKGACLSSDGFFPFRDSIDACCKAGISAIIQPGGSLRDHEVIEACNEHGIAMVFTGERCFSHH